MVKWSQTLQTLRREHYKSAEHKAHLSASKQAGALGAFISEFIGWLIGWLSEWVSNTSPPSFHSGSTFVDPWGLETHPPRYSEIPEGLCTRTVVEGMCSRIRFKTTNRLCLWIQMNCRQPVMNTEEPNFKPSQTEGWLGYPFGIRWQLQVNSVRAEERGGGASVGHTLRKTLPPTHLHKNNSVTLFIHSWKALDSLS